MGIKHVAYLIALTVDTTYWGSYTDLIPHISLFCMLQQNQMEINGLFIHFTHHLSSKSIQSVLEISTTYRLVSNWLICRLRAQCMISRGNFKLFLCNSVFVIIIFLLNNVNNIATVRVRFYHIRNNRGLGCCEPWPLAQVISLTTNLITPDITKTSSSNCLILSAAILGVDPWEPQVFSQWHSQQMPHPPHKNNISPLKSYHFPSSLGQSWFRWEPRSQSAVFQGTPKLQ